MPIEINNTPFEVDGTRFSMICASPVIVNGMIVRVFNTGSTTQTYTYKDTSLSETTVSVPASGSAGNPLYVLAASSSAADSFNDVTGIAAIRLLITGSSVGNAFTEELITTTGAGNWTKPTGVTEVIVECWGGGGAGGGVTANQTGGAGGGGGQYSRKIIIYASAQQSINYSIGTGGVGSTSNGTAGGDTTWNTSEVIAKGGQGGLSNQVSTGAIEGTTVGGVGDVVYPSGLSGNGEGGPLGAGDTFGAGGDGADGAASTGLVINQPLLPNDEEYSGLGGISGIGSTITGIAGQNGGPGGLYAAGGGGGGKNSGANRSGGNGAQGLIRLIYR